MLFLNSLYIAVNNNVALRRKKSPKVGGSVPLINGNNNFSNVATRSILSMDNQISNDIKIKGN